MNRIRLSPIVVSLMIACGLGCASTSAARRKPGQAIVVFPLLVAQEFIKGILDSDETAIERDRKARRDRQWKQHWRDHPDENRAMHEAFRGDYD
jgi:hypothetical protein